MNIRGQMEKENLFPKKSLGQNFLIDDQVLQRIVVEAGVGKDDVVLEIGAGVGNLTAFLAPQVRRVIAVEIDRRLVHLFKKNTDRCDNIEFYLADALEFPLTEQLQVYAPVKVVANLPYLISTPILFRLLEHRRLFSTLTLMLQKEMAERLAAGPGTRDYSAFTVAVTLWAEVSLGRELSPVLFFPRPGVASRLVHLTLRSAPLAEVIDEGLFREVVKAAFGQRRKMLGNALKSLAQAAGVPEAEVFATAEIDPKRRGETLSVPEFARLANEFKKRM